MPPFLTMTNGNWWQQRSAILLFRVEYVERWYDKEHVPARGTIMPF
jgi:hypothetical protein